MKKIILSLIFIITLNSCKSTFYDENIEIRIYRYHIGVVENFYKTGYLDNDDSFLRSITFLENLTKIKCNFEENYVMVYNPSKININDWKNWLKKNNEKLHWNEAESTMEIK